MAVYEELAAAAREARAADPAWGKTSIWTLLSELGQSRGDHEAYVAVDDEQRERRVTYRELRDSVRELSAGFATLGIRRGEKLAIFMTNRIEWIQTHFAAQRLGVTVIPISTWLTEDEVLFILRKSGAQHIVVLDEFRRLNLSALLDRIAPNLPAWRNVICLRRKASTPPSANGTDFAGLLGPHGDEAHRLADSIAADVGPEDVALIKFTSGSTGFPKGAVLLQWGLIANGRLHSRRLGITADDRWFSSMPFFHAGGSIWGLMTMLTTGGTLVFTEAFNAELAVSLMDREQCTAHFATRTMVYDELRVLETSHRYLTSLWLASRGDPSLVPKVHELFGARVVMSPYGLTEGYGPCAALPAKEPHARQDVNGLFFDGIEYRVVDPQSGHDVPYGSTGECLLRGLVMEGYYDEPEQTAKAIDSDGWLHTQDLIQIGQDGYVTYVGRIKAMLKVGGENVAIEEVEICLRSAPGVADCCVIGVPDSRKVEAPRAYVVARDDAPPPSPDELRIWCSQRLAAFKVPRDFILVQALPLLGNGKVDRKAVMQQDPDAGSLAHAQG